MKAADQEIVELKAKAAEINREYASVENVFTTGYPHLIYLLDQLDRIADRVEEIAGENPDQVARCKQLIDEIYL